MEFDEMTEKYHGSECLPEGSVLHEKYTVLYAVSADYCGISYLVREKETDALYRVRECFPHQMAVRSGLQVTAEDAEQMNRMKQQFIETARILREKRAPHLAEIADVFEENETAYCVSAHHTLRSLADTEIPMTPAYVRSLGIVLCDTYAALHKELFCGRLTKHDVLVDAAGSMYLSSDHFFADTARPPEDIPADLQALCAFLAECLKETSGSEENTEYKSRGILREVFSHRYSDAAALKRALICEEGAEKLASTSTKARRPMLLAALCVVFLALGIVAAGQVYQSRMSLHSCLRTGAITPGVIDVWAPLPAGTNEQEAVAVYERLTEGFEQKYPGYGVNLTLYGESGYEKALQGDTDSYPVVFMDTRNETVLSQAEDLTLLHRSLHESYMTDMEDFGNSVPLGCTFPALYWNSHRGEDIAGDTIAYEELSAEICYDASVSWLDDAIGESRSVMEFSLFMGDGSMPVLADSSRLYTVQHTPTAVGTVQMLPVSVNGRYPLEYDMYCSVNARKDTASKRIGMLWLQYLLTEEAQDILFSDGGGTLPIHRAVMQDITSRHSQYGFVDEALTCFDTTLTT